MKYIYVCSPYSGYEENYKKAVYHGKYVAAKGYAPIIPHTMLHGVLNDKIPDERKIGLETGKLLLKLCAEVWVFGNISAGMRSEIDSAESIGIPVRYIKEGYGHNEHNRILGEIFKSYEELTGRTLNRAIADDIVYFSDAGLSDKLIEAAVKEQARRNANWKYAYAILSRCMSEGVLTAEEFYSRRKPSDNETKAAYDLDLYEQMLDSK